MRKCLLLFHVGGRKRHGFRQAVVDYQPELPTMARTDFIRDWFTSIFRLTPRLLLLVLPRFFVENRLKSSGSAMPIFYHDDEAWADIEPLPQDDGGLHPLAAIAYSEEYSEAMGYLRAVMAKNEFSERVLGLTEHIISMNPAHYTVW